MKFWDSSALIPLLVEEEATVPLRDLSLKEPGTIVWWGTSVECASAVSRRPSTLELVCLDDRLSIAAQREGFVVRNQSRL